MAFILMHADSLEALVLALMETMLGLFIGLGVWISWTDGEW